MKTAIVSFALLIFFAGCKDQSGPTPEQIRADTAKATRTVAQDAKAVAQGVSDAVKHHGPVNINTASEDDLRTLPGVDAREARKIIAGRPYDDTSDLVKKHVITGAQYDRISAGITTH